MSGVWKRPRPFFTEATFLALSDTHILAAARVNGDHVHSVTGEIPPMGLGQHNAEVNQKMAFIESTDGVVISRLRTCIGDSMGIQLWMPTRIGVRPVIIPVREGEQFG